MVPLFFALSKPTRNQPQITFIGPRSSHLFKTRLPNSLPAANSSLICVPLFFNTNQSRSLMNCCCASNLDAHLVAWSPLAIPYPPRSYHILGCLECRRGVALWRIIAARIGFGSFLRLGRPASGSAAPISGFLRLDSRARVIVSENSFTPFSTVTNRYQESFKS